MNRITPDAMRLAAEWLDCYEGEEHGEGEVASVASFLRAEADRRELAATVRKVARERGLSQSAVRLAVRRAEGR